MLELKHEFLCEIVGDLAEPQAVGDGPHGVRVIFPITGGTVKGPKINAEVLPVGADWIVMRKDGVGQLDVRATARTDDGALIYTWYRGLLKVAPETMARIQAGEQVDPNEYYFRTTPVFETGDPRYAWLNQIIAVGVGKAGSGQVRYKVYQIL